MDKSHLREVAIHYYAHVVPKKFLGINMMQNVGINVDFFIVSTIKADQSAEKGYLLA